MLVSMAAKCLAGLASGLRKKFGTYAGHVSEKNIISPVFVGLLSFKWYHWLYCSDLNPIDVGTIRRRAAPGSALTQMNDYFMSRMCLGGSNYSGEVQGEETSGCPGPAGGY